jgi:hypothetical protein
MLTCIYLFCRPQLLQVLIGLFELPRDESAAGEDIPGAAPAMNGMEAQDDESSGCALINTVQVKF